MVVIKTLFSHLQNLTSSSVIARFGDTFHTTIQPHVLWANELLFLAPWGVRPSTKCRWVGGGVPSLSPCHFLIVQILFMFWFCSSFPTVSCMHSLNRLGTCKILLYRMHVSCFSDISHLEVSKEQLVTSATKFWATVSLTNTTTEIYYICLQK